ncbi:MAG TPA: discoidin domain-containing protein, partial [Armatimonadota bacterium]|nr:discoidin domain-containing protein [Armatimonadota bacterium]
MARVVVVLSALVLIGAAAGGAGAADLVRNGTFSDIALGNLPHQWTVPTGTERYAAAVDDDGHSGKRSLRVRLAAGAVVAPVAQVVMCEAQTDYVLSAWFKADALRPAVTVSGVLESGEAVELARALSAGPGGWQGASVRFNSGPLSELTVSLLPHAGDGGPAEGTSWFDDVQIVPAAEYRPEGGRVAGGFAGPAPGPNVARGAPYTLNPAPNYGHCTDAGDGVQLTDGEHSVGYFWVQTGTVGWSGAAQVDITIDLGRAQPIVGCSYSTAAGVAGVGWPELMLILVSDDGTRWRQVGDLALLSAKHGLPPDAGYANWRFGTGDLRAYGRYFRLLIGTPSPYTFCDEIEVYGGDFGEDDADPGTPVADPGQLVPDLRVHASVRRRLLSDIARLRAEAESAPTATAAWAASEADRLEALATGDLGRFGSDWRAIHPLTPLHAQVYSARARVWRERGEEPVRIWTSSPWDPLEPLSIPGPGPQMPSIDIGMVKGEHRAGVFNITNLSGEPLTVDMALTGLPGGPHPPWLTVYQVEWIETQSRAAIAGPLIPAEQTPGGWRVTVPSGMVRQMWLDVNSAALAFGQRRGAMRLRLPGDDEREVNLSVRVYPLQMPDRLSCSLGLWDYTGLAPAYGLTLENQDEAVVNMRQHFVDTPWASPGTVPWPKGFDEAYGLAEPLDFARFDDWVSRWPGATHYALFLAVGQSLAGIPMTSEGFPACVASWMHVWMAHVRDLGIHPSQLMLLLVDEPSMEEQEQRIILWAKAIKAAEPEVLIWEDPVHSRPELAALPEMFAVSDVLCPNLGIFASGPESSRSY